MALSCPLDLDVARLRAEVEALYTRVATDPAGEFHFHRGATFAAQALGYDAAAMASLPPGVTASFAGMANPFAAGRMPPRAVVMDVGSGTGTDANLAAAQVGPEGRVIGVDPTPAMLDKARALAAFPNVEFRRGSAESLPAPDGSIDVLISNGVFNLAPDKTPVLREVMRVLKPGGRLQLADIIVASELSDAVRRDIDLWTG